MENLANIFHLTPVKSLLEPLCHTQYGADSAFLKSCSDLPLLKPVYGVCVRTLTAP